MTQKIALPKPIVEELIDHTIIPFKKQLIDDDVLSDLVKNPNTYTQLAWHLTKLEEALFIAPEKGIEVIHRLCEFVRSLNMPTQRFHHKIKHHLFELVPNWLQNSQRLTPEQKTTLTHNLQQLQKAFLEQKHENCPDCAQENLEIIQAPEGEDGEDTFFAFESADVDDAINDMHTSDEHREVISASEFMAQTDMDMEFIDSIDDHLEDLEVILHKHKTLTPDTLVALTEKFNTLAIGLNSSFEFADLGYGLIKLAKLLETLPLETLSTEQQQLLKQLLEEFISDLFQWTEHVFIDQDAQDIHYLDAALLASIEQMKAFFSPENTPASPADNNETGDSDFIEF